MRGYGLPTAEGLLLLAASVLLTLAVGAFLLRAAPGRWMRGVAWAFVASSLAGGVVLTRDERAGTRMLLLCAAIFLAMKVAVTAEARLDDRPLPPYRRWLAFVFLWPGMRPWAFAARETTTVRGGGGILVAQGTAAVAAGVALMLAARAVGMTGWHSVVAFPLGLTGLSLLVHFGLFRFLAGFWRTRGATVAPLFDHPMRSRSLSEFWSRRWNLAFSEMVQVAVHRPLAAASRPWFATMAVFLFSGLVHELAISVPARAGYGLPSLYFALHGGLTILERRLGIGSPSASRAWGRVWTLWWVLAPVLLVFHPWFLAACVVPLFE